MSHTLAASRLGRWGVALAAATVGALSLTSVANATIYRPTDSTQFRDAVLAANANAGYDKILIPNTGPMSPSTNLTITDDLLISANHAYDASAPVDGPVVSGGSVDVRAANFITVNPGVTLTMSGMEINLASDTGFATILNNGTLRLDNVAMLSNGGRPVDAPLTSSTTVITNSTITDNSQLGPVVNAFGSLTMIHNTITNNVQGVQAAGPWEWRNNVIAEHLQNCFGTPTGASGNRSSDSSCGPGTTVGDPGLEFVFFYPFGPTQTRPPLAGSPLVGAADSAYCLPSDQGFNVRPATGCDIGAVELNAPRDTTPPTCVVTATRRGPDEQDVTVSDTGSGLGYDSVFSEEITITNGSVAYTGLPAGAAAPPTPSRPGNQVLTAVKATQGQSTRWSFTARDWAGNTRTCS